MSRKSFLVASVILLVCLIQIITGFFPVKGAISACDGEVDPTTVLTNASPNLTFTLNNSDSNAIVWVKFTAPSSNFTITDGSTDGMTATIDSGTVIRFTSGNFPGNSTKDFTLSVTTGSSAVASAAWTVQVSDSANGSNPTSCTGSFSVAISSTPADVNPPTISNLSVSDVSQTSVKVTWTTDELSTSVVNYGTTTSYGSTASSSSLVTSHNVELTGLSANTTYHYSVQSADADGNTTETNDNTFVSSKAATTVTTTTTTTSTVTKTVADTTGPAISLTTDFSSVYTEAPTIEGRASDDVGVTSVDYSTDDGANWLPVDELSSVGAKTALFEFTPLGLTDGNYKIRARVTDPSGNQKTSKEYILIIDRLPPAVGATLFFLGPQELVWENDSTILILPKTDAKIILSAVGGPIQIDIVASREGTDDVQSYSLVKNPDNGLWWGTVSFSEVGDYILTAKSVDGAENKTERQLNKVKVIPSGVVSYGGERVEGAEVSLYFQDSLTSKFYLWDGKAYGQENPQKTNRSGEYFYFIPPGTYYLEVKSSGHPLLRTQIFKVDKTAFLNQSFELGQKKEIHLGSFKVTLPLFLNFLATPSEVKLPLLVISDEAKKSDIKGQELPYVVLASASGSVDSYSLHGKPTVLTFLSTWYPQTSEQLGFLEILGKYGAVRATPVMLNDSRSETIIFKKRGGYEIEILADSDGVLVAPLKINTLPTHVFLDRKGVIKDVKIGILNDKEMLDILLN